MAFKRNLYQKENPQRHAQMSKMHTHVPLEIQVIVPVILNLGKESLAQVPRLRWSLKD